MLINKDSQTIHWMKLVETIRKKLKLNPWNMAKLLGRKDIRSYLYLERQAKNISLSDLHRLYKVSKLSASEFLNLVGKEAKRQERTNKTHKKKN